MKTKQNGFAVLESLLIIVIIAVIGGIGWYAYSSKNKTDKILSQADKISQNTPIKQVSSSSTSQNYITINEWGVKIIFADADKTTYTTPVKCSDDPSDQTYCIGLELKSSVTSIKDCQSLGVGVTRSPVSVTQASEKVGSYYYGIGGGPGACMGDSLNGPINQLRSKIDSSELTSAKIEPVN